MTWLIRAVSRRRTAPGTNWERYAGQAYLDLTRDALDDAREASASLERRATASLAASGAFVTVLFGLAVGAVGDGFSLAGLPRFFVTVSIVLLLWAALFAVLVQVPRVRQEAAGAALLGLAEDAEVWQSRHWTGTRRAAESMANAVIATRAINTRKAWDLRAAYICQGLGILMLGAAVVVI